MALEKYYFSFQLNPVLDGFKTIEPLFCFTSRPKFFDDDGRKREEVRGTFDLILSFYHLSFNQESFFCVKNSYEKGVL